MGFYSWLAARFSRSQVVQPVEMVAQPALYYQHTRIGGGLTPEQISDVLRSADTGYMWRLADLANESRQKDCHLQSILGTREMAVSGLRTHVIPCSDDKEDIYIADWCSDWIANFGTAAVKSGEPSRDWRYMLSHLAGAAYFGYAVTETLYAKEGKYLVPSACRAVEPRRFVFDIQSGNFRFWDVQGNVPYPGTDLMAEFPGRFVDYHPRINGDYESREGLARLLVWCAMFRNWTGADWQKLAEIAWKPWRKGKYNTGRDPKTPNAASKEDRAALVSALQLVATNGVMIYPDTTDIQVEWPGKGSSSANHGALMLFLASEMSKAVLGQTLTTEQGKVGSQALGEVQDGVRCIHRDADAAGICGTVRRDMMAPAVRLNFGNRVRVPGLALLPEESVDQVAFSTAIGNYAKAGLAMPANWVRERAKIAHPLAGDELVGGGVYLVGPDGKPIAQKPPITAPGGDEKPGAKPPVKPDADKPSDDEDANKRRAA